MLYAGHSRQSLEGFKSSLRWTMSCYRCQTNTYAKDDTQIVDQHSEWSRELEVLEEQEVAAKSI